MSLRNLHDIAEKEIIPGFRAKFVHSENMTLAYWRVTAEASLPEHAHIHEQITTVIEGNFELTVDGKTYPLEPGDVLVIPSQVKHSGRAITDCRLLDVFSPARDDYRNK